MTFMPMGLGKAGSGNIIPGEGPKDAKIALVGEAGGAEEDRYKRPFVGNAGRVLEQCMHAAGMIRAETYMTNVIKLRPKGNDISPYYVGHHGKRPARFTPAGWEWVQELYKELNEIKPNIIVALGNVPMTALTRRKGRITTFRGYIEEGEPDLWTRKVLPTLHPSATFFRGEKEGGTKGGPGKGASPYIGRYYISHDLRKAKQFSSSPDLERPIREMIYSWPGGARECVAWIKELSKTGRVSLDIEVVNFEIACISLAANPELGIGIPLSNNHAWSVYEEASILRALDEYIFSNPKVVKVLQNGIFDLWMMHLKYGILTIGPVEDTMIGHHIMYFEFAKSLEFLASIHCGAQEYWKDWAQWDNIKENA